MTRNNWWLVAAAGLAVFMAALDTSIVTVALPTIEADFGVRPSVTEWVVLGYLLSTIALVLPSGRWLDGVGRRAAFACAVAAFAGTSVLAGLAPGIGWLVMARIGQGAAAAMMLALLTAVAAVAVRREALGRAMGIIGTCGPLGAVSGPAIGGVLVATWGWPAIFLVNAPIAAVVIAIGWRTMPADGRLRLPDRQWGVEAALLGGATLAALLALSLAPAHGILWALAAVPAVPLLAAWWRLPVSRPVTGLLRQPGMAAALVALGSFAMSSMLVQFLVPFFLHEVTDLGPRAIGVTVLAYPAAMAVIGPVGGALADRVGLRRTAVAGALATAAATLLLVPLADSWSPVDVAWRLAVLGLASGLSYGPVTALALAGAPRHLLGTTSASTHLARALGFALGPALATATWALADYSRTGMRTAMALGAAFAALTVAAVALHRRGTPEPTTPDTAPAVAELEGCH